MIVITDLLFPSLQSVFSRCLAQRQSLVAPARQLSTPANDNGTKEQHKHGQTGNRSVSKESQSLGSEQFMVFTTTVISLDSALGNVRTANSKMFPFTNETH
ncbi:hypothetical protein RRG08_048117 [Elysia crispata]|uniref:Uncharacterized protein n=1 Tax=Elysia crispata TaxID=231223 RepID=A0AAE1DHE2_9GAST|nr:hypothetical protein RRG08_048117 [Elysia crispata]